jgi:uncharacterized metal-binding protein YceD (DUF177 family)
MKVRISSIPLAGFKIKDFIPLEPLNARMDEGRANDIFFTRAPEVDLTVSRTVTGAQVKGVIRAKLKQPCSRCMDIVERDIEVAVDYLLEPKGANNGSAISTNNPLPDDDIGITYYEGDHADLEDLIQESLILPLSPYWHPKSLEDGTCSLCGKNPCKEKGLDKSEKITLGALFKTAGIK